MRKALRRASIVLLALGAAVRDTAGQSLPAVHVIGTGGTIGSAGDYWGGNATRVAIDSLVQIRGIETVATVTTEQLWNVSSSAIGPDRWLELSRRVAAVFRERPDLSGIVITHGTDTMEETAFFLDLTVPDQRPVIVTGAMRPSNMEGADGPANLFNAIRAAADRASRGRGAMVLMDDRLFAAREVTKTNTTRVESFQAPERGPLAIVDPEGIFYHRAARERERPQFDVSKLGQLPRVDVVYAYAGADSVAIAALVAAGARGLIVAGVGRGGATREQRDALRRAREQGVVVIMSSRTGSGRVPVRGTDEREQRLGAGDLNPQKARVLLALALTRTQSTEDIARIFEDAR